MCFAPQQRGLFEHLNFQKRSDAEVFCTFWLRNLLRATVVCTSKSASRMVRFAILTLTCASRRNRLQFSSLICLDGSAPAALASLLFDGPGPQTIRKAQCFATFYLFTHFDLLSFDTFSSLIFFSSLLWLFPPLLLHLPILSEVWLLNFLRQLHYYTTVQLQLQLQLLYITQHQASTTLHDTTPHYNYH